MPEKEAKNRLRSTLENKSIEELEQLLADDFSPEADVVPNVEYMTTILEVIRQKESETEEQKAETEAAWQEFQAFLREEETRESDQTGRNERPSLDHFCISETSHTTETEIQTKSRTKTKTRLLRTCAMVAALIILFCGSAYAAGWNVFQTIAQWTEETFSFLLGDEDSEEYAYGQSVYEFMRLAVEKRSDIPAVPNWIPKGMEQVGEVKVVESSRSVKIAGAFGNEERRFTIRITIYHEMPDGITTVYQKDGEDVQQYKANEVLHYIMNNNKQCGVSWMNGTVEGSIQGTLTTEEIQKMIDSIYEG